MKFGIVKRLAKFLIIYLMFSCFLTAQEKGIDPNKEFQIDENLLMKLTGYELRKEKAPMPATQSQMDQRIESLKSEEKFPLRIELLEKRLGEPDRISFPSGSSGPLVATMLWEYFIRGDESRYVRYIIALNQEKTEAVAIKKLVLTTAEKTTK